MPVQVILRTILLSVVLGLIGLSPTYALSIDATVGFGDVAKIESWTPVAVTITNDEKRSVSGNLTVSALDSDVPYPMCEAEVELPPQSKKLYHTYLMLPDSTTDLRIQLEAGRKVITKKNVRIIPVIDPDILVAYIGDRKSKLNFLNSEKIVSPVTITYYGSSGIGGESTLTVGSLEQSHLPDRMGGFAGADVIVISNLVPPSVKPESLSALASWVASGGTLVVSTGPDYKRFQHSFYDEILPVNVTGMATIQGLDSLASSTGVAFPAGPIAVSAATVKPGARVLASEESIPLLVKHSYGAGNVFYLAADHTSSPFKDWNGQIDFWKTVIAASLDTKPLLSKPIDQSDWSYNPYNHGDMEFATSHLLMEVVTQNPSVKAPSFNTVGLFLLSYLIVLVPVNYLVLKRKRKLELAWISTPIIVVAFTIGSYAIGYTMKGGKLLAQEVTIVEGSSGARYAWTTTTASIFSPARRSYDVSIKDNDCLAFVIPQVREREQCPATSLGSEVKIKDLSMAMWSSRHLEACGSKDLQGQIVSDLTLTDNTLAGTLTNNTDLKLRNCQLIFGKKSMPVDFNRDGVANVALNKYYKPILKGLDKLEIGAFNVITKQAKELGEPVLIGFADTSSPTFDIGADDSKSATCYVFRLNYSTGGRFVIKPEAVTGWLEKAENVSMDRSQSWLDSHSSININTMGYFISRHKIKVPAGSRVAVLNIHPMFSGSYNAKIKTWVYDYTKQNWTEIDSTRKTRIENPTQFVDADGHVRIKCKLYKGDSGKVIMLVSAEGARG